MMNKEKVKIKKEKPKVKRKNFNFYVLVLSFYFLLFTFPCFAQSISSSELINNAKQYDTKEITYRGEVIGDIMSRGDYAWLNLNDGYIAIGVWVRKDELKNVVFLGDYRAKGDIIEVIGIFNRSCPEHGGDLDIHAQEIKKIAPGEFSLRQLSMKKFYLGFFLSLAVLFFSLLTKLFQKRRK